MSRAIKFRAWSERDKKFISDYEHIYVSDSGNVKRSIEGYGGTYLDSIDVIIEQFTGIHDKNGVELYEGDVCIFKGMSKTDGTGYIYWSDEGACFMVKTNLPFLLRHTDDIQKIGTIHENPELIK